MKPSKGLRGEQLSELYFKPKTAEERQTDDDRILAMQLARRPRLPRLRVAMYGSALVGLTVFFIDLVPGLWSTGSTNAVAFTFLMWVFFA